MCNDEIVEEIRRIREEHAARFGYDLDAIYADLKRTEGQSGRKVVSLPPKKLREWQKLPRDSRESPTQCFE
jgi:hypothetical protein